MSHHHRDTHHLGVGVPLEDNLSRFLVVPCLNLLVEDLPSHIKLYPTFHGISCIDKTSLGQAIANQPGRLATSTGERQGVDNLTDMGYYQQAREAKKIIPRGITRGNYTYKISFP